MAEDVVLERSGELSEEYSRQLDRFINDLVPVTLTNTEYAARCSALLIALNRQLARCAVVFGEVHGVGREDMTALMFGQFRKNYDICRNLIEGAGQPVQ